MSRPRLLDLFCGAGGAAMGYHRAGFEVVGVDIAPQPHYPFGFHQDDALRALANHGDGFDVIHASPPCPRWSKATRRWGTQDRHPDLIANTRRGLGALGRPYIIENVPGAPLRDPITLCGSQFGLRLRRHRLFESNVPLTDAGPHDHTYRVVGVYGHPGGSSRRDGLTFGGVDEWREAMDIRWMTARELADAIPPAYTEHLGRQLIASLTSTP